MSDKKIKIHSNIYNPDYIIIVDETQIDNKVLKGIKDNTILIINTDEQRENISLRLSLTERQKERMVCIPATRISRKNLGKVFPNIPMLTGIIYNLNIYIKEEYLNEIEKKLRESFSDREELVKGNLNVAKETWEYLEQNYN